MGEATEYFLRQGILGVLVVILVGVVAFLYKKTEKLQGKIDGLMEARRLDAIETREQVTSILPGISQSLTNISDKIEISKVRGR